MSERNVTPETTIDEDAFDLDEERFGRQDADLEDLAGRIVYDPSPDDVVPGEAFVSLGGHLVDRDAQCLEQRCLRRHPYAVIGAR